MERDARQFLMTTAWFYALHGKCERARMLCEALVEDDPSDGVAAAALAEMQLEAGEAEAALATVSAARFPASLARVGAILEARALRALGRTVVAARRWQMYLRSQGKKNRRWIA